MFQYVTIREVVPLKAYRLKVRFSTGEEGIFDLTPWLDGAGYNKLRDKTLFSQVQIDEVAGTVCWPNGIDFDPLILYQNTKFVENAELVL